MSVRGIGLAVGAVAGAAVLAFAWSKRAALAGALNPASPNNLAYQGVNSIVQLLTGDNKQTAGGLAFDVANPRAGLAANEYSPAPGIIVTAPRATASGNSNVSDLSLADEISGALGWGGFASTPGGAATGRAVSRGF